MNTRTQAIIGPVKVLRITDKQFEITSKAFVGLPIEKGDRVLLRTINSDIDAEILHLVKDEAHLSIDAVKYLIEKEVSCVGIDHMLNNSKNAEEIHRLLTAAHISLIEGLRLGDITPGAYEMICLPLPADGTDQPRSRVILKPGKTVVEKSYA